MTPKAPKAPTLPDTLPTCGRIVIYCHGDPRDIGGQLVDLPMIVVEATGDGRVAGQAFLPPGAGMQTAQGVMPMTSIGVIAAYSAERKCQTWRWPEIAKVEAPSVLLS